MILDILSEKSLIILGFGLEGQSSYEFVRNRFPDKAIAIADRRCLEQMQITPELLLKLEGDKNVRWYCAENYLAALQNYEVIIKTAGIPSTNPAIRLAETQGTVITSQTEMFFDLFDRKRVIGITGTKGKSTTTSLTYKIIHEAGLSAILAGNIGEPLLAKLDQAGDDTLFIVELSSYQLDNLTKSPHIAVLLNIFPEHLDYHPDFAEYAAAKERITRFQSSSDFLVYNFEHPLTNEISTRSIAKALPFSMLSDLQSGCFLREDKVIYSEEGKEREILQTSDIPLLGAFNRQNVLAAVAVAGLLGIEPDLIRNSIRSFTSLPHRLEFVGEYGGVKFYNDSISTIPECTLSALEALGSDVQTLILGGHERHLDYSAFAQELLKSNVKNLILFPPTGKRMWDAIQFTAGDQQHSLRQFPVETMEEAINICFQYTEPGKVCLLSPAAPSYSNFTNHRERGDLFRKYVQEFSRADTESDISG